MDMDTYERLTAETRRRGTRFDALIGLDEVEGSDDDEEERAGMADELPCQFCGEELDAVGLLCHMDDEHHAEANAGDNAAYLTVGNIKVQESRPKVCPICTGKVDVNLVSHMSSLHQSFLKDKRRNRQGSSGSHYATLAFLKEDPHERISGSSRAAPVSTVPDPLLSSFVGNFYEVDLPRDTKVESLDETEVGSDNLELKAAESVDEPLLPEVKEERTRRSQFVQGLVLSLMFDDIL
ncbi:hypothetical protein C2845_PM06G31140 [Panicum miliaceum]|uniref:Uncharacterized protein n=1 Tax=Panicum miliaceum TaxID=4540 RepID=A0A3L6R9J0_PANMI|nr:hypothetical protein C2845_PM06G31140 [Panicum miliaceum]